MKPSDDVSDAASGVLGPSAPLRLSERALRAAESPISTLMQAALANPGLISLAAGFVDQASLPVAQGQQAIAQVLADSKRARAALQYGTTKGYFRLRETLLERFVEADGRPPSENSLDPERLVVTAGSNQVLHLVSDALLDPGDIVLCPSPCYFVYLGLLANLGARAFGVSVDAHGMVPADLEDAFSRLDAAGELSRVKLIYVVSYFDNPCGVTVAEDRRAAIVEIAKRWSTDHHIHILEDVAYRELRYEGEDVPSLRAFDAEGDTVIVAQTFSKSFSPGLRVGYGLLPKHLVDPIANLKGNLDFGSPNFNQHALQAIFELGLYDPHVAELCVLYRGKLEAMLDAADALFGHVSGVGWLRPKGGLYVWMTLPESIDAGPDGALFHTAVEEGVLYVPGEYCFPPHGHEVPKNTLRLSFGVQSPERIREGMECFARAVRRVLDA